MHVLHDFLQSLIVKNVPVFDVHVLGHLFHDFVEFVDVQIACVLGLLEFSSCVGLTKLLKIVWNSFQSDSNMSIFVFLKQLITLIQSQDLFFLAKIRHSMISDILCLVQQRSIVIISH